MDRQRDIATNGDLTAEIIDAGLAALENARCQGMSDRDLVCAVCKAIRDAAIDRRRFYEFAWETIYNMRGIMGDLERCERRAVEHAREVAGDV
jgi:hypothetical protein